MRLAFIGCLIDCHVVGSGGGEMPVRHGAEFLFRMGYCCRKFLLNTPVLAVRSFVIGCSRAILTKIMCDAMNRDIFNVISGGMNVAAPVKKSGEEAPKVHVETPLWFTVSQSVLSFVESCVGVRVFDVFISAVVAERRIEFRSAPSCFWVCSVNSSAQMDPRLEGISA